MSTYKRINGDYTIQSVGPNDVININSAMVTINGNLQVTGNSQTIVSTNSAITDNKITLNHGLSTSSPPNAAGAVIEVDRGTSANVQLRWSETYKRWQINNTDSSEGNFANIATSAGATTLANIYADSAPAISANLDLRGHTIWDSTTNTTVLTLSTVGGAGSGVYVTPTGGSSAELVTQSKALAYAIIFG
jgi:hypothetical protein